MSKRLCYFQHSNLPEVILSHKVLTNSNIKALKMYHEIIINESSETTFKDLEKEYEFLLHILDKE